MKKKAIIRLIVFLGFFLFSTLLLPTFNPNSSSIAYASNVEKDKSPDYRLYLKTMNIIRGNTHAIRIHNLGENSKVSYKSADTEIASVNDDGIITAKNVGTTTITVTIRDGGKTPTTLTGEVKVGPPAFSVKVTKSRIILGVNQSEVVNVILKPSNTIENAVFSTGDKGIATVSTGGRVTGVSEGLTFMFAVIDALNHDGNKKFAACTVIVVHPDDVSPLETYFSEHPELNLISETDLLTAIDEFFKTRAEENNSSTASTSAKNAESTDSFVDSFDKFLGSKFDLGALRKTLNENTSN